MLCIVCYALSVKLAMACDGAQNIQLLKPVQINPQDLTDFSTMAPLKIVAVSAPPMALYDEKSKTYDGVGIDILCFITKQLGLRFELSTDLNQTVKDKIQQVQKGQADIFIPLSQTAERAKHGLFTTPYYESYYAVIGRKKQRVDVRNIDDLAKYRVGIVAGVALEPTMQAIIPADQLHLYDIKTSDALFEAVRSGDIDFAVFNQDIFIEKRYRQELFDLDIIHTLYDHPRAYRYYFSNTPKHQRIVHAFDRYLDAINISASITAHADGEAQFLERYVAQRSQKVLLQAASIAAALLALIFYVALIRYRRGTQLLASRNACILQQQQELQAAYKELEAVSQTDSLTKLANRRHFDEMLAYEYTRCQRTQLPLSVLIIDVDNFKSVNDNYGHGVGDSYLCSVADVLKNNAVRSTDLVARYGGDEFACLLPETSPQDAYKVAKRISQGVAELNLPNAWTTPKRVTLSIGIASVVAADPGAQSLMSHADKQLYNAKEMGRNRIYSTTIESNDT